MQRHHRRRPNSSEIFLICSLFNFFLLSSARSSAAWPSAAPTASYYDDTNDAPTTKTDARISIGIPSSWNHHQTPTPDTMRQMPVTRKKKKARVESSSNVFLENLHSTKNLVTVYYITNVDQLTDFVWFRDSGIRVNIGLQNINLLSIYEDVDHRGDNSFMLQNPNSAEEAKRFASILNQHCSNPLPDFYNVTLEIHRDRTTRAVAKACSPAAHSLRNCEFEPGIGSYYLHRSVNEPCALAVGPPEMLKPAANSIICTEGNDLLHRLFKMASSSVHPISYSSSSCSESYSKCQDCLRLNQCRLVNDADYHCCHGDCFHSHDCKQHFSAKCRKSAVEAVECATGDAFSYTLTPVFLRLDTQFRCHVRRKPPDILYRMWFFLTIPINGSIVETPRKSLEIFYSGVEDFGQGSKDIEFLTIQHWTGSLPTDDLILVGSDLGEGGVNFTVESDAVSHRRRTNSDDVIRTEWVQSNAFAFSAQFERPFTYSTSTWVDGGHSECDKDISVFRPVRRDVKELPVSVVTRSTGSSFQYTVTSPEGNPHLRFSLPGNVSILSWWFRDNPSVVIFDRTFQATLSLADDHKTWTVKIAGKLTRCPGYFEITVNDHSDQEEVAHYDALVSCPPSFTISFHFPNHGMKKEKTYELILNDLSKEQRIYLTKLNQPGYRRLNPSVNCNEQDFLNSRIDREMFFWGSSFTLAVMIFVIIFLLFCIFVDLLCSTGSVVSCWQSAKMYQARLYPPNIVRVTVCCSVTPGLANRAVFCPYFLMRLVYSVLFTCTTISLVLGIVQWNRIQTVRQLRPSKLLSITEMPCVDMSREKRTNDTLNNCLLKKFHVQRSCNSYLNDVLSNFTASLHRLNLKAMHHDFSLDEHSATALFRDFAKSKREDIYNKTKTTFQPVLQKLNQSVHHTINYFCSQLSVIFNNLWFNYARSLSRTFQSQHPSNAGHHEHRSDRCVGLGELAILMEMPELEEITIHKSTFLKQLEIHFEKVLLSLSHSQGFAVAPCHQHKRLFGTSSSDLQQMNSTRFFASPNSLFQNHNKMEEHYYAIDRHSNLFVSPNSSTLDSSADSIASSDDDLFFYRVLSLKLLHFILFVDTFLIIYRVTNLCLEITSRHESRECIGFVHDNFDSLPQEIQKVKKKEKCVSFADLDKCSNELTKNFHSMQDMNRKLSTTATTTVNVGGYVRCNSSSMSMPLRPDHGIIQEGIKPRLFHVLITLNSLTVLCPNMGSAADKQPTKGFRFAYARCTAYARFFWKLVRRSDAVPKVVFASALVLLLGLVLNVVGQNVVPKFILSFVNFCPCNRDDDSYLQDFVDASNKELLLWQSTIMKFEVKQLQGIFEFFNAGYNARLKNYRNSVCSLHKPFGLPISACLNNSAATKSLLTYVLPCNFIHLQPLIQEEEWQSSQLNVASGLMQEFIAFNGLLMSVCIVLCLFITSSFIFQLIISAFCVLKLQNLTRVRTFMTASDWNLWSASHLTGVKSPGGEVATAIPVDDPTKVSCSLVNVSSVSSSINICSNANFKKFSETKV